MDEKISTPAAPAFLPTELQKKWAKTYATAMEEAQNDHPGDATAQKQAALREANRMLRVPALKSYEDAVKLADWQVVKKEERDGQLKVVTIDGRKYAFDIVNKPTRGTGNNQQAGPEPPTAA